MTAAVAPITALLLSVALLLMGNGLQGTLLPVRADIEAFGALDIGVLGSSYFFGFAIGCLYGPHVVRRAGHIRTFTAMVAVASCVVLGHALVVHPLFWWLPRQHRLLLRRALHGHRELAEREVDQREPQPRILDLHDHQPDRDHPRAR